MGKDFWGHLGTFIRGELISEKAISPEDLDLLQVTDSPEEAVRLIREGSTRIAAAMAID
jgi:predicted Rossmann-fold nucleotide-binding protein